MRQVALYVLRYALGCAAVGVFGAISAMVVWSVAWLLPRRGGLFVEMTFGVAGLVGLAMFFVGIALGSRALVDVSALLWGWIGLLIMLIPFVLVWRLFGWFRRITAEPSSIRTGNGPR
jgi:uncharacterized membrane protein YjfL (UPF0719 family)